MNVDVTKARSIFTEAVENHAPDRWDTFLDGACGKDLSLRRRVELLLKAHRGEDSFLDRGDESWAASPILDQPITEKPGTQIGPYKIRELLAEGGMGMVYVAEQSEPVRRKVALKIVKPGMASPNVVARFEAERQALAMMDHPNIARVFDGGATGPASGCPGQPYFVMELVRGIPITEYCDHHRLTTRQRLHVFLDVCRAVQHAHQKGVIHRDIKPSNVLVAEIDGAAVPKVIDFGVAKAISHKLSEQTVYTEFSQFIGTPLYMSPEQAGMGVVDIDTRSDVYSLGVLLYELLTGSTPFDRETLRAAAFDEWRRVIREDEPRRPSAAVSTLQAQALSTVAERRQSDPRNLCDALKGELDWLVMKALEKDRNRRYESAAELARDVERYLHDEPVQAYPPSVAYRLRKFTQRHKALLTTGALVLMSTLIGLAATLWYARKATLAALDAQTRLTEVQEHASEARRANAWSKTLLYAADMKLASDAIADHDLPRAVELLQRHRDEAATKGRHGFEWHFFDKRVTQPPRAELDQGGWVNELAVSHDGKWMATTASGDSVRVYATSDWKMRSTLSAGTASINGLAWSPDGMQLAAACADGSIRTWTVSAGEERLRVPAHQGEANDVIFSQDGRWLYSCGDDHLAKGWDAGRGDEQQVYTGHQREVEQIALSPGGNMLATASSDSSLALWDLKSGTRLYHLDAGGGRVVCVTFSTDGRFVAAGTVWGNVVLVETSNGHLQRLATQSDGIEALTFFSGNQWLATADRGGAMQLYSVSSALKHGTGSGVAPTLRWMAHQGRALSLATTRDGQDLVSGGRDGLLRVWTPDIEATRWATHQDGDVTDFACGQDNHVYVAGRQIDVWNTLERRLVGSFAAADTPWICVAGSSDGRYLAAARVGQLVLFDLSSRRAVREWPLDDTVEPYRLAVSSTGRSIALADFTDREFVTVYAMEGPREPRRLPARQCYALEFSPDERWLAAGQLDDVLLFDLHAGGESHVFKGHTSTLSGVAFSPDGKLLATVGHDRLLKVWRIPTGGELFSVVAHQDYAKVVDFTPDGRTIATAGDDKIVKLWHVATGQPLGQLTKERWNFEGLQFAGDGRMLVGRLRGSLVVYDASSHRPSVEKLSISTGTEFAGLGNLPGAMDGAVPEGISNNGRFVVGKSRNGIGRLHEAFRWSPDEGIRSYGLLSKNSLTSGISDDGSVLCGSGNWSLPRNSNFRSALVWTGPEEARPIFEPWSHATDITPDGKVVVGRHYGSEKRLKAFRWEEGKSALLASSPDHMHAGAVGISADGVIILGMVCNTEHDPRGGLGESAHLFDVRPVIWTNQGIQFLPDFDPTLNWWPDDLSADGVVVVGVCWPPGHSYRQPTDFANATAFRWSAGQAEMLPSLPGCQLGMANGVSGDGFRVVGHCIRQKKEGGSVQVAVVWDKNRGVRAVSDLLASAGVTLDGWELIKAGRVSEDGTTIAGVGFNPDGQYETWRARLPREVPAGQPQPPASEEGRMEMD